MKSLHPVLSCNIILRNSAGLLQSLREQFPSFGLPPPWPVPVRFRLISAESPIDAGADKGPSTSYLSNSSVQFDFYCGLIWIRQFRVDSRRPRVAIPNASFVPPSGEGPPVPCPKGFFWLWLFFSIWVDDKGDTARRQDLCVEARKTPTPWLFSPLELWRLQFEVMSAGTRPWSVVCLVLLFRSLDRPSRWWVLQRSRVFGLVLTSEEHTNLK